MPATSPFFPNTSLQFAWDSVSIGLALSCWRKYQYRIIEGWTERSEDSAIALKFGIAFHTGLEAYHKARAPANGLDHEAASVAMLRAVVDSPEFARLPSDEEIAALKDNTPDDDDGITYKNSVLRTRYYLFRALVWYVEHYRKDAMKTVILADGTAAAELSFRVALPVNSPDGSPYILAGHLDRLVEFNGQQFVADYKTTKSLSSQFFASFTLSHQMAGYTYGGQQALAKPVVGVVVDGIALQVGGVKFGRAPTRRTPGQMSEFFDNFRQVARNAEYLAERRAADPSFDYPMNTQSCYFCEFKGVCSQPPEFRRRYLAMEFKPSKPWNPLESR